MRTLAIFLISFSCHAGTNEFFHALNMVETGGKSGEIWGDNHRALGGLQIHKAYWQDSGVAGSYQQCTNYDYSVKVATAYFKRFIPKAFAAEDWETCARVHNSGPNWQKSVYKTNEYWNKVKKILYETNSINKRILGASR